jgi:hypothetical protein
MHRFRSVIYAMDAAGDLLFCERIVNDPLRLLEVVSAAGEGAEVVIDATYGGYWAVDLLASGEQPRNGGKARSECQHPLLEGHDSGNACFEMTCTSATTSSTSAPRSRSFSARRPATSVRSASRSRSRFLGLIQPECVTTVLFLLRFVRAQTTPHARLDVLRRLSSTGSRVPAGAVLGFKAAGVVGALGPSV